LPSPSDGEEEGDAVEFFLRDGGKEKEHWGGGGKGRAASPLLIILSWKGKGEMRSHPHCSSLGRGEKEQNTKRDCASIYTASIPFVGGKWGSNSGLHPYFTGEVSGKSSKKGKGDNGSFSLIGRERILKSFSHPEEKEEGRGTLKEGGKSLHHFSERKKERRGRAFILLFDEAEEEENMRPPGERRR